MTEDPSSIMLPTITLSLGFLLVPALSLVFSAILLEETITTYTIAALILIVTGSICVAMEQRNSFN